MFKQVYVEIGNVCNLNCSFCPKTQRAPRQMSAKEFEYVCKSLEGHTDLLQLHVLGEPLLHESLEEILDICDNYHFKVCITTNGTLLKQQDSILIAHSKTIKRICISLHSFEANSTSIDIDTYLNDALDFAKSASKNGIFCVFRLWNLDSEEKLGSNIKNEYIQTKLKASFSDEWQKRWSGYRLAQNVFLEYSQIFTWPNDSTCEESEHGFCHGMLDHIAILADGTVVPCCLDGEGIMNLGNIFKTELTQILSSQRASLLKKGLQGGRFTEKLCQKCSYSRKFAKR